MLHIYTHPACAGCGPAVRLAWELGERTPGRFELRTVSLEGKEGLAEAHRRQVKTIPTLVWSAGSQELSRLVGLPTAEALEQSLSQAESQAASPAPEQGAAS